MRYRALDGRIVDAVHSPAQGGWVVTDSFRNVDVFEDKHFHQLFKPDETDEAAATVKST